MSIEVIVRSHNDNVNRMLMKYPLGHEFWSDIVLDLLCMDELLALHAYCGEQLRAAQDRNCPGLVEQIMILRLEREIQKGRISRELRSGT